jgi:methylase of polypeptide subunit release factors
VLVELFVVGMARPEPLVRQVLAPLPLEGLIAEGLLARDGDRVSAPVRLAAFGDLLLASDRWTGEDPHFARDFVIGAHDAAISAANLSVRLPVANALDLGTGTGVQALLASRHAEHVVATDLNGRALAFGVFNAALNGARNVSFLEASWFEPIRPESGFGLIVCNPPFAISPERSYLFRDGGLEADGTSRLVIEGAGRHLAPGGHAHIVCDWVGSPERVFAWTSAIGCDTLLIRFCSRDPYEYACTWNDGLRSEDLSEYDDAIRRWTGEFERLGVERIESGIVVLRRPVSGRPPWRHVLDSKRTVARQASDELLRIFAAQDLLQEIGGDGAELLERAYRLVEGHSIEQMLTFERGAYVSRPAVVRIPRGSGLQAEVAVGALDLFVQCDGFLTLGALVAEQAVRENADEGWLRGEAVKAARALLEVGLLEL